MNEEDTRSPVAAERELTVQDRDLTSASPSQSGEQVGRESGADPEGSILGAVGDAFAEQGGESGSAGAVSEAEVTIRPGDVSVRAGDVSVRARSVRPAPREPRLLSASPIVRRRRLEQLVASGIK